MVEYLIVETPDETRAWEKQVEAHESRVDRYIALGHPIVYAGSAGYENISVPVGYDNEGNPIMMTLPNGSPGIVPLRNGIPDYSGQITWSWDVPRPTPDETIRFSMPTDVTPEFTGVFETDYTVRPMPTEWIEGYTESQFNSQFDNEQFEV